MQIAVRVTGALARLGNTSYSWGSDQSNEPLLHTEVAVNDLYMVDMSFKCEIKINGVRSGSESDLQGTLCDSSFI